MGGTLALLAVLALGTVAVHYARRFRDGKEPLFPDAPHLERDPVTFTEGLAKDGRFDDERSRFAEVAARSGLEQAYALLARATADDAPRTGAASGPRLDPRRALATLATIDDEDRRLATFVAQTAPHVIDQRASARPERAPSQVESPVVPSDINAPERAAERHDAEPTESATSAPSHMACAGASLDDDLLPRRPRRGRAA